MMWMALGARRGYRGMAWDGRRQPLAARAAAGGGQRRTAACGGSGEGRRLGVGDGEGLRLEGDGMAAQLWEGLPDL